MHELQLLNGDDEFDHSHWKPYREGFGVYTREDFNLKLLPQGAWARCLECMAEIKTVAANKLRSAAGAEHRHLGGNTNNPLTREERAEAGKLGGKLGGDTNNIPREERTKAGKLSGITNNSVKEKRKLKALAKKNTRQACERTLPQTQLRGRK